MYPLSYLIGWKRFKDGAWFEPSDQPSLEQMIELLELKKSDVVVDLGSGDGTVVLEIAKNGASAYGIERDPKLVAASRESIAAQGLAKKAKIIEASFWDYDLSQFNKVAVYQFKTVMRRLEQKLLSELPKGAMVVSNYWNFPSWKVDKTLGYVRRYIKS